MGILDFFRGKGRGTAAAGDPPDGRAAVPRALERHIKRLLNKHLHTEERWASLQAVAEDRSDAAVDALVRRLGIYVEPSAVDNEEKEYVADVLAGRGDAVVPSLLRSFKAMETVTWQVRILGKILHRDALRDILIDLLAGFDTEYERNPQRKIEVIKEMAEFDGERVAGAVARFLEDVNEEVRFQALAALAGIRDESTREAVVAALLREESVRVRNAAIDLLVDAGWAVHGHRGAVEEILPKGFVVDRSGVVKRRPKA